MRDKIEKIGKTIIHHGKSNNRIYLMKFSPDDAVTIAFNLERSSSEYGYTKIFAKIPSESFPIFIINGYHIEACIPKFYNNTADCLFVSKFMDQNRSKIAPEELEVFMQLLGSNTNKNGNKKLKQSAYQIINLTENNANEITGVFKKVFETYPFPVHDPTYIIKTMIEDGTRYYGIRDNKRLIGVSTAEIDNINKNAEMTDFAVLPEYRGQKLAYHLLHKMEAEMKADKILTVYTIARLKEPAMNKTFLNSGYKYTGTLVNNTNIGGSIESMNILYKHL